MHARRNLLAVALTSALAGLLASPAAAADQVILGKTLLVQDTNPNPVINLWRKIIVIGAELASPDTLVGNPLMNGASIEIIAHGATSSSDTFAIPAGAYIPFPVNDPARGSGWKALGNPVFGYVYKNHNFGSATAVGVMSAVIKKVNGKFFVKVVLVRDTIDVGPPAPGADGGMRFTINGGDTYCVNFGGAAGGLVKNAPATGVDMFKKLFKIVSTPSSPTVEAGCPIL